MANILYSAYFCNPSESSESYTAVKWLEILLQQHNVKLLTNRHSGDALKAYFGKLPANLEIFAFDISERLERKRKLQIYFGYFSFDAKSYKFLKKNPDILNWADVILKKTPSSFRYYSSLHKLNKPLVVGPIGGGLQFPKVLKSYFKSEPFSKKLRVLDKWLLQIPPFRSQFEHSHKILITLDYLRDILPARLSQKMVTILDTGIDLSDRTEIQREEGNNTLQLLYVGRLVRSKGAELLLKALIPLKGKFNFFLNIVGEGRERPVLEKIIQDNGLENMVRLNGNMKRTDVFQYYRQADIFCFPSLTEASGNVLLEAMVYKLPIITINNGGPKFMTPDNGAFKIDIQHEEGIIKEIARYIELLQASPAKRKEMGQANYEFLEQNFSWEVLNAKINSFFKAYEK